MGENAPNVSLLVREIRRQAAEIARLRNLLAEERAKNAALRAEMLMATEGRQALLRGSGQGSRKTTHNGKRIRTICMNVLHRSSTVKVALAVRPVLRSRTCRVWVPGRMRAYHLFWRRSTGRVLQLHSA